MKKQIGCGCGKGVSRRRVLQTGLAAAAAGAMGGVGDALAESQTQAAEGQGMSDYLTYRDLACRCRGRLLVGRGFINTYPPRALLSSHLVVA